MALKKKAGKTSRGIIASPGIAIGKAYVLNTFHLYLVRHSIKREEISRQVDRFHSAVEATREKMAKTARESVKNLAENMSYILHPQIQLLKDPTIIDATVKNIEKNLVDAEWALKDTYDKLVARFKNIQDPYFKERLRDFGAVIYKVLQTLTGKESDTLESVKDPVIVIAHDLTPFDTAQMVTNKILGFVTEVGGKTSHTGIIASSLQIPAVVGVKNITSMVESDDRIIVDGISGRVLINPSDEEFVNFNRKRVNHIYFDKELERDLALATETKDAVRLSLQANVESSNDINAAIEHGAEGIGLFRTEFLFVNGRSWPGENEQFEEYKKVALAVAPHSAVIRTLDLGGDKLPWVYKDEPEPNPALGLRAIRYCFENRHLFIAQLRAILRASHYGDIRIMYPMISSVEELRKANSILAKQKRELKREGIPFNEDIQVGMMVEVPSVAIVLDQFTRYVDFFSIGTNDLIQYLLAIDRGHEKVAHLYEPLHPAVLRMLNMIIKDANRANVPVSVCGRMGADPLYAYLLVGMGKLAHISMESHSVPKIKRFLRNISVAEAVADVEKILDMSRVRDIRRYLIKRVSPVLDDGLISEVLSEDYGRGIYR